MANPIPAAEPAAWKCARDTETLTFATSFAAIPLEGRPHYNWFRAGAERSTGAVQGMMEPLFFAGTEGGAPSPWLANEAIWNDARTELLLTVAPKAAWSDRMPVVPADLVYSFRTVLDHAALDGPHVAAIRDLLASVEIAGPRSVLLTFRAAAPDFVTNHLTAGPGDSFLIVPEHLWRDVDPVAFDNPAPVGSGPYVAAEASQGRITIWQRHDGWWAAKARLVHLPTPQVLEWTDAAVRAEELARRVGCGTLDVAQGLSAGLAGGLMDIAPFLAPLPGDGPAAAVYSRLNWQGWSDAAAPTEAVLGSQLAQQLVRSLAPAD